jgi:hypothetical protein
MVVGSLCFSEDEAMTVVERMLDPAGLEWFGKEVIDLGTNVVDRYVAAQLQATRP